MNRLVGFCLISIAGLSAAALSPAQAAGERLFYEIMETAAGYRSQSWQGILYEKNGEELKIKPGEVFDPYKITGTLLSGRFVGVECLSGIERKPCGAIPEAMLKSNNAPNNIMKGQWSYKLYVSAEGRKSVGTRGELQRDGVVMKPQAGSNEIETPMGVFFWKENPSPFDWHGWYAKKR